MMKKMSFDQHVLTDQQLKQANRLIMQATLTILNNSPNASRASRFVRKLNDRIVVLDLGYRLRYIRCIELFHSFHPCLSGGG